MPSLPPRPVPASLREVLPLLQDWVERTAEEHRSLGEPLTNFAFPRLARYFPEDLLADTTVVVTDVLPKPPVPYLDFPMLREFRAGSDVGITILDVYFVLPSAARDEAVCFHELVHVVQWAHLGPARFIEDYAAGLVERGYALCPLEHMAFEHEARFAQNEAPYDVPRAIRHELDAMSRRTQPGRGRR